MAFSSALTAFKIARFVKWPLVTRLLGEPLFGALDKLRSGPTRVSGPALRAAIDRLKSVRELGITLPAAARIPESRRGVGTLCQSCQSDIDHTHAARSPLGQTGGLCPQP